MSKSIWAPKGMDNVVCCKIPYKGYEISIAMDDSCGVLRDYSRSDICVLREYDGMDVTEQFYKASGTCIATADNLKHIFTQIDMYGDRD